MEPESCESHFGQDITSCQAFNFNLDYGIGNSNDEVVTFQTSDGNIIDDLF